MSALRQDQLEQERSKSSQFGFTLIELLIALTLFGLLSVALLGGLRFGTRVWKPVMSEVRRFMKLRRYTAFFASSCLRHGFWRKPATPKMTLQYF